MSKVTPQGYDPPPPYDPVETGGSVVVRPTRFRFATPEDIGARTGARHVRGGWKEGSCPSCGERKLKISWGRDHDRTLVRCHADLPCPQRDVVAAFSQQGLSLVILQAGRKPRRRSSSFTAGMDPIERALWHCTKAEELLYRWFKRRGDGPAKFKDTPLGKGKNAGRAIPVLEHLGLIRVDRGRFDPRGGGRAPNVYEVARARLFHPLEPDDHTLKAALKAIRRPGTDAAQPFTQNINDGAQVFYTQTSCSHTVKMTVIRTCCLSDVHAPPAPRRRSHPSRKSLNAARVVRAAAFTDAVGLMVLGAGGSWEGRWRDLLAAVPRPAGFKAWPLSRRGVMSSLWLGREALRALGLRHEWVHRDGVGGMRILRAIRVVPAEPESASGPVVESAAERWSNE